MASDSSAKAFDSRPRPTAYTPAMSTDWMVYNVGLSAPGNVRSRVNRSNHWVPALLLSLGSARTRGSSICRDERQHIATMNEAKPGSPHFRGFP